MMYRSGDIVDVYLFKHSKPLRGKIREMLSHSYEGDTVVQLFSVELLGYDEPILANSTILKMIQCKDYNGNELTNWADLRHIWRPNENKS